MKINYLDLFSGIGGFTLGLLQAGFEFSWHGYSEVDIYANEIYRKRFPNAKELGDVKKIHVGELPKLDSLVLGGLAKIYQLLATGEVSKLQEAVFFTRQLKSLGLLNPRILSLKMSKVFSQVTTEQTLLSSYSNVPKLGMMCNGNYLILSGYSPNIESGYTLLDILEKNPDQKYFLSEKAIAGVQLHKKRQLEKGHGFGAKIIQV
jgi:hypothetical protein